MGQDGERQHEVRELIGIVVVGGNTILRHRLLDLAVDGEDIVTVLKVNLDGGLFTSAV